MYQTVRPENVENEMNVNKVRTDEFSKVLKTFENQKIAKPLILQEIQRF